MLARVRGYLWIVHLTLGGLGVWLAFDTVMAISGYGRRVERPAAVGPIAAEEKAVAPEPFEFYGIIPSRNLFGVPPEGEKTEGRGQGARLRMPLEEKPSDLPLRLVGTTLSGGSSLAIIEDLKTRKQIIHRVGDVVEGARIAEIRRAEVTLVKRGREEVLRAFMEKAEPPPRLQEERRASGRVLDRAQLREVFKDLENLGSRLRAVPYMVEGTQQGVRVFERNPPVILSRLGLRNGEAILSINGQPLEGGEDVAAIFWGLLEEGQVVIEVERGKSRQSLRFEVR